MRFTWTLPAISSLRMVKFKVAVWMVQNFIGYKLNLSIGSPTSIKRATRLTSLI